MSTETDPYIEMAVKSHGCGGPLGPCSDCQRTAELLRRQAEKHAEKLLHWQTCSMCGEKMEEPGFCSVGESEVVQGLNQTIDELLDGLDTLRRRIRALKAKGD